MTQKVTTVRTVEIELTAGTTGDLQAEINAMVARNAIGTDSLLKSIHTTAESKITVIVQKPDTTV
jgi:hypothetical protein